MVEQYLEYKPQLKKWWIIRIYSPQILYWIVCTICLTILSVAFHSMGIFTVGIVGVCIFSVAARGITKADWSRFTFYTLLAFVFLLIVYFGLKEQYNEPYYGGDDKLFEEYGHDLYESNIFHFRDVPYIQGMFYAKGYLVIISWIFKK